jgi:hypothetical protein
MKTWLLSYMRAFGWNATGLILSAAGVLILFRFGMPFRLSAKSGDYIVTGDSTDPAWLETTYQTLGYIGLLSILVGTAFQVAGAYLS